LRHRLTAAAAHLVRLVFDLKRIMRPQRDRQAAVKTFPWGLRLIHLHFCNAYLFSCLILVLAAHDVQDGDPMPRLFHQH
jgi:hypothetical protein